MSFSEITHPTRFDYLVELAHRGGRAESRDLRAVLGMNSPVALLHHTHKLKRAGLVAGQGTSLALTDAGKQVLGDMAGAIQGALQACQSAERRRRVVRVEEIAAA
jgi:hypothetical protein